MNEITIDMSRGTDDGWKILVSLSATAFRELADDGYAQYDLKPEQVSGEDGHPEVVKLALNVISDEDWPRHVRR